MIDWTEIVVRCENGHELDLADDELDDAFAFGCPDCDAKVDSVKVDRMQELLAAGRELAEAAELVASRQPALRGRVDAAVEETLAAVEAILA